MKKLLLAILLVAATLSAKEHTQLSPLFNAPTFIWAGIDFSQARLIGTKDFSNPNAIFPGYLNKWNNLFIKERLKRIEGSLKKTATLDLDGVEVSNHEATRDQIIRDDPRKKMQTSDTLSVVSTHIDKAGIANGVKKYKLKESQGLGLVFVVDRFVKQEKRGAIYFVFFDVATREVLVADRYIGQAGGAGFRNLWFNVFKNTDGNLKKYRS
jgi:hypothetical protein